jgi:hypothetical protein
MVYLLKMGIFHGKLLNNQRVPFPFSGSTSVSTETYAKGVAVCKQMRVSKHKKNDKQE